MIKNFLKAWLFTAVLGLYKTEELYKTGTTRKQFLKEKDTFSAV